MSEKSPKPGAAVKPTGSDNSETRESHSRTCFFAARNWPHSRIPVSSDLPQLPEWT